MSIDGELITNSVTDTTWLGLHEVQFEVYLKDIDSSALYTQTLGFTLNVEIYETIETAEALEIEEETLIVNSLVRKAPVSVDFIAPVYRSFFGEKAEYIFNFVDPLALVLGS